MKQKPSDLAPSVKNHYSYFTLTKAVLFVAAILGMIGVSLTAYASTPVLSVSQSGNSIVLTVSGATPHSPVYLFQRQSAPSFTESASLGTTDPNGNFTSPTQIINFDGSSNPLLLYVMVNSVSFPSPSTPLQIPPGTCASSCASGTLSLSQTSVAINSPSSITVTAFPSSGNSVTITSNSNSSVANAFASNDSVIITGEVTGSATINVCSTASTGQCGSIFVSVNGGSSNTLNFSNANPIVIAGQSSNITIYSPSNSSSNYYISNNSNTNVVVSPSVSGSTLYFSGGSPGTSTLTVCQSSPNYCGTITVTVGNNGSGGITINPNTLTLTTGNTGIASISNSTGALAITNNSNSSVVSASVSSYVSGQSSQTVTVYAEVPGSSTLTICPAGSSVGCVYLYVQVSSNGSNNTSSGGISFSVSNPIMTIGQSQSIAIYSTNGVNTYSISNNSSANVVSLSLSGSSLYLVGQNLGSSTITVCQTSTNTCATLYVTVNGSGSGLTLNPSSVSAIQNQSSTVAISGGSGNYYISSNSNPSAAAVSLQGSSIYITGLNSGTASVTICDSSNNSICGAMVVTVGSTAGSTGSISFSNSNPVLGLNQSQSITINGGGNYYISSISNPSVLTVNLSGSQLNLTGITIGNSSLTICQTGVSNCSTMTVTVNTAGSTGTGSIYFSASNLPAAVQGQFYSYQLQAQGGNGNYTYALSPGGSLPAGLTVSSSGLISGTLSGSGSINVAVNVTATDSSGATGNASLGLLINGGGTNPIGSASSGGTGSYPSGELINENGTISIVYQNTKTGFANAGAFTGLGFSFGNVVSVANSGLASSGQIVNTSSGQHPWGSWVLNGSTVYFVQQSGLIPVPDWNTFLNNGGQASFIVPANSYDMALPQLVLMSENDTRVK